MQLRRQNKDIDAKGGAKDSLGAKDRKVLCSNSPEIMADFSEVINQISGIINVDRRLRSAASTTHQLMAQRIFGGGIAANGSEIGNYSETPAYFSPAKSPKKFSAVGKSGKGKFKNGNAHKTRYFENGYAGFRQKAGRQSAHVDLRLTGTLESSFVIDQEDNGYASGFLNSMQAEIAEGNEAHFETTVFQLTEAEENQFAELMIPE